MLAGTLFTLDFLTEGIAGTDDWSALSDDAVEVFASLARARLRTMSLSRNPNEAETEGALIWPTVETLGWDAYLPQQKLPGPRREDVPDLLLFANAEDRDWATRSDPAQRRCAWSNSSAGCGISTAPTGARPARLAFRPRRCCATCVGSTT